MKRIFTQVVLFIIAILAPVSVYSGETYTTVPIGRWVIEKPHPSGAMITVQMQIGEDHHFSGSMLVNGAVNWTFAGDWEMSGNEITYTYRESSKPLPENYKDTDVIISIDETSYSYTSKLSGETNTYTRVN